jgi:hypothetical protein
MGGGFGGIGSLGAPSQSLFGGAMPTGGLFPNQPQAN